MSFLTLTNIHKTYANTSLLRGVSFAVERGTIACLLGASGSGKTTLLRIIAGLEAPEDGHVHLDATDITTVPTHQRGIVLMFQDYALFPHKTVAQNVAFGLEGRSAKFLSCILHPASCFQRQKLQSTIAVRVQEMLTLVGLEGFGNRDVHALSGGERQRVALARSLAPQPRLLLLDEPLGALDRNLRERLLEELPGILHRVGVTAITVTHDQEEAFALADHVILLNAGRVIQSGPPQHVYDHPTNVWAARFLGLNNLFITAGTSAQHVTAALNTAPRGLLNPRPVLIHPWGIHLTPAAPPLRGDCQIPAPHFTAQVTRCTFHGPIYHLTLQTPGGELHLTRHPGHPIPTVGHTITGWIDPAALRWLNA